MNLNGEWKAVGESAVCHLKDINVVMIVDDSGFEIKYQNHVLYREDNTNSLEDNREICLKMFESILDEALTLMMAADLA